MNTAIPPHEKKGNASRAWIFRSALGAVLIGVSAFGITLCREIFRVSIGPGSAPGDSTFASLGAWAAWALFFGPLAVGGVAMVWSTLRKMGALDHFASWLGERAGRPDALVGNASPYGEIAPGNKTSDPHGLESLSAETVKRLQHCASRAATVLGGLAGAFLLGIGILGLVSLLFFSGSTASSSIYMPLATVRLTVRFAVFSGMLVFLGITILRHTFRGENSGWLLPLRMFTFIVLRRRASEIRSPSSREKDR